MQVLFVGFVVMLSNVPAWHYAKRALAVLPFAMIATISLAMTQAAYMHEPFVKIICFQSTKVILAAVLLTVFSSTTKYTSVVYTLSYFKVPKIITSLLYFLYGFVYLLTDEIEQLAMARDSRDFGSTLSLSMKSRAWLVGTFLLRSAERSDVIYKAMAARGYDGNPPMCFSFPKPDRRQKLILAVSFVLLILVRFGVTS
jgi:cobalt/nickel transport system permease protein